jgi:hypothetical protein
MACIPSNVIDCPCDGLENLFVDATYFVDSVFGNGGFDNPTGAFVVDPGVL